MIEEQILVVPTGVFHELGYFQGFSVEVERYRDKLLSRANLQFRPRSIMEKDPQFKQLIPYLIFCYTDKAGETSVFSYVRGKGMGEDRLHSKRSVGIGGHINAEDAGVPGAEANLYYAGMNRELHEEVRLETTFRERCVGLINDDLTEVGKVHLGIVHRFDLDEPLLFPNESDIIESGFIPVSTLLAMPPETFESWSSISLQALFGK